MIQTQARVVILSGLPGSGKSRFAERLRVECVERGQESLVCSADDHHLVEGEYRFNPKNAAAAHRVCMRKYLECCVARYPHNLIIVDNTNTSAEEIAPYLRVAEALEIPVSIKRLWVPPEVSFARNTHAVPLPTILAMYRRMLEPLPSTWPVEVLMGHLLGG
jgi:tRNA uridine 5-carbamoylmethylation protein Kti12